MSANGGASQEPFSFWQEFFALRRVEQAPLKRGATAVEIAQLAQLCAEELHAELARSKAVKRRCLVYGLICSFGTVGASLLTIVLWSDVGLGDAALVWLGGSGQLRAYTGGGCLGILLLLYVLDFFCPPHLPGQYLRIWRGDRLLGRSLLALCGLLFCATVLLTAGDFPSAPMLLTQALAPVSVALLRLSLRQKRVKRALCESVVKSGDLSTKMQLLTVIIGWEADNMRFISGALGAFVLAFAVSVCVWFGWAYSSGKLMLRSADGDASGTASNDVETEYFLWATPLIVAICNLVFSLFMVLRILMQRTYVATDRHINQLVIEAMSSWTDPEVTNEARKAVLKIFQLRSLTESEREARAHDEVRVSQTVVLYVSRVLKGMCSVFLFLFGMLYVCGQLLYTDDTIAITLFGMVGSFCLLFVGFTYFSFRRIVAEVGRQLKEQPVGRFIWAVAQSNWARGMLLTLLPVIPFVLLLSLVNQQIRRLRGLYSGIPPFRGPLRRMPMQQLWLTPRVFLAWHALAQWNWLSILPWVYVLCCLYVCYAVFPLLLNVCLSWLTGVLQDWPYLTIAGSVFAIGLVAFLLPWVPGLTVYVFGGLVLSDTCPWGASAESRFWAGSMFNIILCWFLKLAACAVQQKLIGESLGKSLKVRQFVGVHRSMIRCIEAEMRVPGWTVGKVAILCGGPDWPTSVLAGMLRLSLLQCEIGTIPIIVFVVPCALAGSFYLKKGTTEMWTRSADLMMVASLMVNMLLWAMAGWAIQNQFERNEQTLTRPLKENVELEWLDWRSAEIQRRVDFTWQRVPMVVRVFYFVGAVVHVMVCHVLLWFHTTLFGSFKVADDYRTLAWFGQEGCLFTLWSLVALSVYLISWLAYLQYVVWRALVIAGPRTLAAKEVDAMKESWQEEFFRKLSEPPPSPSQHLRPLSTVDEEENVSVQSYDTPAYSASFPASSLFVRLNPGQDSQNSEIWENVLSYEKCPELASATGSRCSQERKPWESLAPCEERLETSAASPPRSETSAPAAAPQERAETGATAPPDSEAGAPAAVSEVPAPPVLQREQPILQRSPPVPPPVLQPSPTRGAAVAEDSPGSDATAPPAAEGLAVAPPWRSFPAGGLPAPVPPSPPSSPTLSPCMQALSLRGPPSLPKAAPLERIYRL